MYFENKLPYIIYIKFRIKKMSEYSRIPNMETIHGIRWN